MIDTSALPAPTLAWADAQAPACELVPLADLPPASEGIVAALGPWEAHTGRRWYLCGALGGVMRKCGFSKDACEAVIREWLPEGDRRVDVPAAVKQALGAWRHSPEVVSGEAGLAAVIGAEHAAVVLEACTRARRPGRALAPADPYHLPAQQGADPGAVVPLALDCTSKGTPRPTQLNVMRVLESAFDTRIRYETARGRIEVRGVDESLGRFPDGEWSDEHTTALVVLCDTHRLNVPRGLVGMGVRLHSRLHEYNLLSDGLMAMALAWDGVPRVDAAFSAYWGAPDNDASRAAARVFFLSLVARGLEPGTKVDTCPIFVGKQGSLKSSALEALVGREWFADSPLPMGDAQAQGQAIQGKWLWEFQEHTMGQRERDTYTSFLSQKTDRYRASYGEFVRDVPRTCTFVSTSNRWEVLNDPTGARRFVPVDLMRVKRIAIERIVQDRAQLLGEAAHRVIAGEAHWPTAAEDLALASVRERAQEHDAWEDTISEWLAKKDRTAGFALVDLFHHYSGAIPTAEAQLTKQAQARAAAILTRLGWSRGERTRNDAGRVRLWRRVLT